jgi:hypothetical protein
LDERFYIFWEAGHETETPFAWTTDWAIAKDICDNQIRNARDFTHKTFMLPEGVSPLIVRPPLDKDRQDFQKENA